MTSVELKKLRQAARITQGELAAALGISRQAITAFEGGWRPVPNGRIRQIEAAVRRLGGAKQFAESVVASAAEETRRSVAAL